MIDRDTLRQAGFSDALIEEVMRVSDTVAKSAVPDQPLLARSSAAVSSASVFLSTSQMAPTASSGELHLSALKT
jgi:hypothetical protein